MDILDEMERLSFEQIVFCHEPASSLKAIIAIHSTKRGPAIGGFLCGYLHAAGVRLIVSDVDGARAARSVQAYGATVVRPEDAASACCDIFAPCALGGGLNDSTIPHLRCKIVAGSANNQLGEERHGDALHARGIVFAPDFAINAGGLIVTAYELDGRSRAEMKQGVERVFSCVSDVLAYAQANGIPTWLAANKLAERSL